MTLEKGNVGSTYRVESLNLSGAVQRRLQALGLTEGTQVSILNHKKNGATIFKVRGTRLAIGADIASSIYVQEVKTWEYN